MEDKRKKKTLRFVRKWGRLVLAIVSSVLLLNKPVFSFPDEKGWEHLRTHIMTPHKFERHHIEMATGIDELVGAMSVEGFFYGALAILLGCIACAVLYEAHLMRILASTVTAYMAGAYYLLMIYYALRLSEEFYLMLYPNLIALLPTVILITMLSIRNETVKKLVSAKQKADEGLIKNQ